MIGQTQPGLANFANFALQGAGAVLVAIVFQGLFFIYRRRYLQRWTWSWWALAACHLFSALIVFLDQATGTALTARITALLISQAAGYWQVALLLAGAYELASRREISIKTRNVALASLFALANLTTFVALSAEGITLPALRAGLFSLFAGAGFIVAAWVVWRRGDLHGGVGQRVVSLTFLGSGIEHFLTLLFQPLATTVFYGGLISLLPQSLMAVGMVIWLLEDERGNALTAAEALRVSEDRYRNLVEHANDIIYTTDLVGNLTSLNRAGQETLGYALEEAVGRNLAELVAPEQRRRCQEMIERTAPWTGATSYELEFLAKDGGTHTLDQTTRLVYKDGLPCGIEGIARDITERRSLEMRLNDSQKMEAIGRLAGGVAHDFNNLLTVISGYTELLIETMPPGSPAIPRLGEVLKASERAAGLTSQLLAFGRRQIVQPRTLDLNAMVVETEKMLRRLIGEQIVLETHLDSDLGSVRADPVQVQQVIINLAVNARDAMPDGGRLTLSTANVEFKDRHSALPEGPYVMLAVTDDGQGMDVHTQRQIFEPFFTTKGLGKGTGLGLATVYGIIKQHNGEITVSSAPGCGTAFRVYLPRMVETVGVDGEAAVDGRLCRGHETILIVEDEAGVRELMRETLKARGYDVLEASPEEALALSSRKASFDLLLTDVVMPTMSGRQLADRLTQDRPSLKVLYVSGYTDEAIDRHGVLNPGVAFLQKPFAPSSLAAKVRQVLDAHNKSRATST